MIESTAASVTYLFSDIEGSTRLWEADPVRAARTVAWHDEISRSSVQRHRGTVVKTTGDGVHAVFDDPADAVAAVVELQLALAEPSAERASLNVRCGLHLGADQRRDNDFYGPAVNRAARIMSAAHGGQVLASRAVADRVTGHLPPEVVLRDLGSVRLRDLGSPEHVFQVIHPALRKDFPPLRSMASTPNNLPEQLNSFVGRDRDMVQVQQMLANSRLLTLLGMGGLGKSRLSVQVAAVVLDNYPDGVWFVELAALSDPQLVPQAVASVLGVKEEPGGTVTEALTQFVRDKQLLIVLDNCEHVVQACAELAKRLLEAGPKVKVLASSRDSLRIAGEIVFPVAPLPAPEEDDVPSVDAMMAIDSVRLFIDRAKAVQPAFRLTEGSVRAVAEICRRLDGIPLAIELAAARVRALSVEQIAARLGDRFRLLSRGDRTALPRQQTLRALIDWSHDLLDAKERALFRRLAVFAGGWTLEAAEAVGAGGDISPEDVLDLLSNLVEKSLVARDSESGRFRMLDTVRHYAEEILSASDDAVETRLRHCTYFAEFAEQVRAALGTSMQAERLRTLDANRDNVLLAFGESQHAVGGDRLGFRLMQALRYYLINRGMPSTLLSMCAALLTRSGFAEQGELRFWTLFSGGQVCYFMGQYQDAARHLQESLLIAREMKDQAKVASALQPLGMALVGIGDMNRAEVYLDEALELAIATGSERERMAAMNARAMLHRTVGELDNAMELYQGALGVARQVNDHDSDAAISLNIAITSILRLDYPKARDILSKVANFTTRSESLALQQSLVEICGALAAKEGDWRQSGTFFGFSENQAARSGLRRDPADEKFASEFLSLAGERGGEAFRLAVARGGGMSSQEALSEVRSWLSLSRSP